MTQIETLNPVTDPDWNKNLGSFESATVFHTREWAKTLAETYRYKPRFLCITEGGQIKALLPMMEIQSVLTGKRGIGLPFTDECQPLGHQPESVKNLFEHQQRVAQESGWKYIEIRGQAKAFSSIPSEQFYTHELELNSDEDFLFKKFSSSNKRAIRKAEREDLVIDEENTWDGVKRFYRLQCITRKRHGLPPQPLAFFKNLYFNLIETGIGSLYLAAKDSLPVAGAVFLAFNRKAVFKFGASDKRYQSVRANNLIMWEAIKSYSSKGFETLNFGRTDPEDEGLRRFKLGWGSEEKPLSYARFDLKLDRFVEVPKSTSALTTNIFRTLPISINRLAGKLLYRHVA